VGGAGFPVGGAGFPVGGVGFPMGGAGFPVGGAGFPVGRLVGVIKPSKGGGGILEIIISLSLGGWKLLEALPVPVPPAG
jgi:hypothetical protein